MNNKEFVLSGRQPKNLQQETVDQLVKLNSNLSSSNEIFIIDEAGGGITYIGWAAPGSATSDSVWRLLRLDESSDPETIGLYADGDPSNTKIFDDRASYSYS